MADETTIRRDISFNSIVVRLKVIGDGCRRDHAIQFQFHSGSIKSPPRTISWMDVAVFQFHSGSIKSYTSEGRERGIQVVSIP